jgi:hypothetical protein
MDKQFILFASTEFYPCGGMGDCKGAFDTLQAALDHATAGSEDDDVEVLEVGSALLSKPIVHVCCFNVRDRAFEVHYKKPLSEYVTI